MQLPCKPLFLCPPKPLWSLPSSYTIFCNLSLATISFTSAMPPLYFIYLPSHTPTSLPGLMPWFWWVVNVGQGFILNALMSQCHFSCLDSRLLVKDAEIHAILYALEWVIFHFLSSNYPTVTLFFDSQSILITLLLPCHTNYSNPSWTSNLNFLFYSRVVHLMDT